MGWVNWMLGLYDLSEVCYFCGRVEPWKETTHVMDSVYIRRCPSCVDKKITHQDITRLKNRKPLDTYY